MKKFLLLLPLLSAFALPTSVNANWLLEKTLGIYSSNLEAETACRKWVGEGGVFFTKHKDSYDNKKWTTERFIRGCRHEEETTQWLGVERTNVKKDETYQPFNLMDRNLQRVKKHFKY